VKRLLSLTVVVALLATLCGCGSKFFIRGAINTGTISGSVSTVELTSTIDDGTSVTVTLVTFLQSRTSSSMNFCGDQRALFPLDQFVSASFTMTPACASIVQIVIG
jgi:hypothetical protein